jgi:hypothetical protein
LPYDLGFSREEIRTFAVVAASVAVALVVREFFGKKLCKLKWLKRRAPPGRLGGFLFPKSMGARSGTLMPGDDFLITRMAS